MIEYFWKPQWVESPQLDTKDTESLLNGGRIVKDLGLQQWDLFRIGDEIVVCTFSGAGGCWLRKMTADETVYLEKQEGKE